MTVTVRMTGSLPDLADDLRQRLRNVLIEGAEAVAEAARQLVLAQRGADRPARSVLAESITVEETDTGARVTATAAHAPYVELGTFRQPAEPFLAPALAQEKPGIIERAGEALRGGRGA